MVRHVLAGDECALDGANQSGKTIGGAALLVALAQGRASLGEIELPALAQPTVWWVLTQTYKQQVESTQKAVLRWIGATPHKIRPVSGNPEAAQLILVRNRQSTADIKSWSRVWFHVQSTGETLPGGRVDGVWADEPPDIDCWQEAMARGQPGRPFFKWITYTPIRRREWEPLKLRFAGCDNQPSHGRIRLHASIKDNPWLSPAYVRSLEDLWRGQWDYDARMFGAEVDDTGSCPFMQSDQLRAGMSRWQSRVKAPELIELTLRSDSNTPLRRSLEIYHEVEQGESYYATVDPSLGIPDPQHDPGEFCIFSRMKPKLVARFGGYLEPYALGFMAARAMQRYAPQDPLDIERNDNLIIQVMRGAREAGHQHFAAESRQDKFKGQIEQVYGWSTTSSNRGGMIAAVQAAILEDSIEINSQSVLDCLRGVVVNPRGRIEAGYRKHDESMICLGRFAHVAGGLGQPRSRASEPTPARRALFRALGVPFPGTESPEREEGWWRE